VKIWFTGLVQTVCFSLRLLGAGYVVVVVLLSPTHFTS